MCFIERVEVGSGATTEHVSSRLRVETNKRSDETSGEWLTMEGIDGKKDCDWMECGNEIKLMVAGKKTP